MKERREWPSSVSGIRNGRVTHTVSVDGNPNLNSDASEIVPNFFFDTELARGLEAGHNLVPARGLLAPPQQ